MMKLYVETGCPYCAKVLRTVDELSIPIEQKNIADSGVSEELISLGGKRQVPYLVDTDEGVQMYESDDIVQYLRGRFEKAEA